MSDDLELRKWQTFYSMLLTGALTYELNKEVFPLSSERLIEVARFCGVGVGNVMLSKEDVDFIFVGGE